jgi:hypothetical protein
MDVQSLTAMLVNDIYILKLTFTIWEKDTVWNLTPALMVPQYATAMHSQLDCAYTAAQ